MNKVILTGNLCRDIEAKSTNSGMTVISNAVAVTRTNKDADGNYISDFINITVWDKQADYLLKYGHKGDRVELVGRWQTRKYTDKNGGQQVANECIVESISVFSKVAKADEDTSNPVKPGSKNLDKVPVDDDDDLPF